MSVFLLILSTLLLLDLAWWLLGHRFLKNQRKWQLFNAIFIVCQLLAFGFLLGGRFLGIRWSLPTPVMSAIYLWHILILPILLIVGVLALFYLAIRFLVSIKKTPAPPLPSEDETLNQTRRQFLITATMVAPPLLNLAFTGYSQNQIKQFRVREMTLAIPDLPPALSGMTICHITDLHAGPFTSERVIRRVVESVNNLQADLVLFTGDLINSRLSELPLGIEFIRSLEARHGVATVEGNHDLFEGRAAFENGFRAAGLRLLVNDTETFRVRNHPVQILGLRWGGKGEKALASGDHLIRSSLDELLEKRETDGSFPILLAHHPHTFDPAIEAGLPLTLSGHTHGGQLMINHHLGAGPLMFRYWSGLYQKQKSQLIVGNGVGNWFPLRTASPAEVTHLILRRAT